MGCSIHNPHTYFHSNPFSTNRTPSQKRKAPPKTQTDRLPEKSLAIRESVVRTVVSGAVREVGMPGAGHTHTSVDAVELERPVELRREGCMTPGLFS